MKNGFARLSQKQQREYDALRQSLRESNVSSPDKARALLANIRNRSLLFGAVILLSAALAVLLFPKLANLVMLIAGVLVIWLLGVTAKGYQLISRYIREELSPKD